MCRRIPQLTGERRNGYSCPMRSSSFFMARLSRLDRGRQRNRLILLSSIMYESRNAFAICSGVPSTAAGSGTPQWAVIGCPGQMGQTSFAALSQTVKTKSKRGESGFANSLQSLLLYPAVGSLAASIWRSAAGCTVPLGWLPALYAEKVEKPFL